MAPELVATISPPTPDFVVTRVASAAGATEMDAPSWAADAMAASITRCVVAVTVGLRKGRQIRPATVKVAIHVATSQ
eukprot:COSAG05_NODE_929_length_6558_cov_3.005264_11_plen_77_part_00